MSTITSETTLREVRQIPEFKEIAPFIMFTNIDPKDDPVNPGLDPEGFTMRSPVVIEGLEYLRGIINSGVQVAFDIWTDEEKAKDPDKENTKLVYMPGKPGAHFVMVIAGGGFATVCSFLEGYPTAMRLNQMGYNAFVLSYRVNESPLFPKPQEDLSAALRFVFAHADECKVSTENYAVAGFSAGGSLTASWGTENLGYAHFGLPKPAALFVCYGASKVVMPESGQRNRFLETMIGPDVTPEKVRAVNTLDNITASYPASYIWHCKDDPLVNYTAAIEMAEKLTAAGVPNQLHLYEKGGHGLGVAEGTPAEGWLSEAVAFWEKMSK